jgi:cellulose biosynthesis protein BcsQ
MTSIAFFNNKAGVGKTTLAYHLAHMLARTGYATVAMDLDPQASLTSAFFDEARLEELWEDSSETVLACISPILQGLGDIRDPVAHPVADNLGVVAGDLGLSRFEDKLSDSWPRGYNQDPAALRATSAFHRLGRKAAEAAGAGVVLMDVGPNLGAINRAALLAADYLVIPLAADLFSLQALRNLGPTVRDWREQWRRLRDVNAGTDIDLPAGRMTPAGYVVLQHAVRLDRPVRALRRWLDRIPEVYQGEVLGAPSQPGLAAEDDARCLATLPNFRSLMPMAQEAGKPMFDLRPADGAIGSHSYLVQTCAEDFRKLAARIAEACRLTQPAPAGSSARR